MTVEAKLSDKPTISKKHQDIRDLKLSLLNQTYLQYRRFLKSRIKSQE